MEYAVYKPDQPIKEFILKINSDGSEEIVPAGEWQEEVELHTQHRECKEQTQEESRQQDKSNEESRQEELNAQPHSEKEPIKEEAEQEELSLLVRDVMH